MVNFIQIYCPNEAGRLENIQPCLQGLYNLGVTLAVAIAFLFVVFGAFKYILGAASNQKGAGKQIIMNAIYGLAFIFISGTMLYWVNPLIFNAQLILYNVKKLEVPKFDAVAQVIEGIPGTPAYPSLGQNENAASGNANPQLASALNAANKKISIIDIDCTQKKATLLDGAGNNILGNQKLDINTGYRVIINSGGNPVKIINPDGRHYANYGNIQYSDAPNYVQEQSGSYTPQSGERLVNCSPQNTRGSHTTPLGTFAISEKQKSDAPQGFKGEGGLYLGRFRIVIVPQRGILLHGSAKDNNSGALNTTHGCVRFRNNDLGAMYNFIEPNRTQVRIHF